MRSAMRLLVLIAIPGLVFGTLVRVMADPPGCDADPLELLDSFSLGGPAPCVPLDWTLLLWIAPAIAITAIAWQVATARR